MGSDSSIQHLKLSRGAPQEAPLTPPRWARGEHRKWLVEERVLHCCTNFCTSSRGCSCITDFVYYFYENFFIWRLVLLHWTSSSVPRQPSLEPQEKHNNLVTPGYVHGDCPTDRRDGRSRMDQVIRARTIKVRPKLIHQYHNTSVSHPTL